MPAGLRRDAECCSTRCRQARHRFNVAVGTATAGEGPLRLAYADPPYPGLSRRYYGAHPDFGGEVDHAALVAQLAEFDGWALSTSAAALPSVLALCPPGSRVAAWHRGARPRNGGRRISGPLSAWEPVIFWGGRAACRHDASRGSAIRVAEDLRDGSRRVVTVPRYASQLAADDASRSTSRRVYRVDTTALQVDPRRRAPLLEPRGPADPTDSLVYVPRARLTDSRRVTGAKPAAFSRWMFDLLGAQAQDELVDVFPGSGGVQRAWEQFTRRREAS